MITPRPHPRYISEEIKDDIERRKRKEQAI